VRQAIARGLAILTVAQPARALADHGGSSDVASGAGPIGVALVWAGVVFVVGMLIVAVIARFSRREKTDDS
jgi:hypothetical protein